MVHFKPMTHKNIEKEIKKRVQGEIARRGLSVVDLSAITGISKAGIEQAVYGVQELPIGDLDLLCESVGIDFFWVTSPHYVPSKTVFRNLTSKAIEISSKVENAFLCLLDLLPVPGQPKIPIPQDNQTDYYILIAEVLNAVNIFRNQFGGRPQEVFNSLGLPVLPVSSEEFDAFLLGAGKNFAVCVNQQSAWPRIRFSLFHELAHFLFHKDQDFTVEKCAPKLYKDSISREDVPEFIANKFAQYILIPFEMSQEIWETAFWSTENLDLHLISQVLNESHASVDVLVNCLYDVSRIKGKPCRYGDLRDYLRQNLVVSPHTDPEVQNFLAQERQQIRGILGKYEDQFSIDVLEDINEALQIESKLQVMSF